MPSYEVDTDGTVHEIDEIKCPYCKSPNTELGDDYLYCNDCKKERLF